MLIRNSVTSETVTPAAPSVERWRIFRRYSDFDCLNAKVKKQLPTSFPAQLPSKRWFKSNFAVNFLQKRRLKLEAWLQQLTRCVDTLSAESQLLVRRFLTAKANTPPLRMTRPIVAPSRTLSPAPLTLSRATTLADFHLVRMLGVGAYGRVILAQHRVTLKLYAMKVLSKASALEPDQKVSRQC